MRNRIGAAMAAAMLVGATLAGGCAGTAVMGTRHAAKVASGTPDKVVCKRGLALGSVSQVKECHTMAEWAAMTNAGAEGVGDVERRVTNSTTEGS